RDAKFSDGSDLTADDVVFSLTRIRDDEGSLWADPFKVMDTVEATDPKTVTIKLKQATAPFLATLAFPIASVLSKK
ncbi:MAG: ABC transporter substrate-binding protein, partial [Mesorhizobium sp.]